MLPPVPSSPSGSSSGTASPCSPPSPSAASGPSASSSGTAFPDDQQRFASTQRVEIRCTCHIDLLDAQFAISHNEQTNEFFVELSPPSGSPWACASSPVLAVLFRFADGCAVADPDADGGRLEIFPASYGHWRRGGSVHRCPAPAPEGAESDAEADMLRLHVHVHADHYAVCLNGTEVERVAHKRPFRRLWLLEEVEAEPEKMELDNTAAVGAGCAALCHSPVA